MSKNPRMQNMVGFRAICVELCFFIMSLIDYLNELIDYSMGFPFYQRLNPLFNGISNEDAPLSSGRSILAREARLARGPQSSRAKMLRRISKDQIH